MVPAFQNHLFSAYGKMNSFKFTFAIGIIVFVATLLPLDSSVAQQTRNRKTQRPVQRATNRTAPKPKKSLGATIRGKVVQHEKFKIPFDEIETTLVQQIKVPEPPVPKDFDKMPLDKKEAWAKKFMESPKGKEFMAEKKRLIDRARVFKVKVEESGRFVVYGVPPGKYALKGLNNKKLGEIYHVHEIFGAIEVLDDVDEMNLKPLEILVTPQLVSGNTAPPFSVSTWDDKAKLVNRHFSGKNLFVCFWSTKSPPSIEFTPKVQKMFKDLKSKHKLELLSINLDDKRKAAVKYIVDNKIQGRHGFADGWNHPTFERFGVRSVPQFFLIDPKGKILMTHGDFNVVFRSGAESLTSAVDDRLSGKALPTPAAQPTPAKTGANPANSKGQGSTTKQDEPQRILILD